MSISTSIFTRTVILALIALMSNACSKREIIRETVVVERPTSNELPTFEGTVDGGGGNGTNGKPLESYIVNIYDEKVFKDYLKPRIDLIQKHIPALASDFQHILNERRWFLIPVDLNKAPDLGLLPPWKLGTYFPTDQIAIQNMKEIWIGTIKFNNMTEEDQARLILHEMIMGVRLLNESNNKLDICLVTALRRFTTDLELSPELRNDLEINYKKHRNKCFSEAKIELSPSNKIELSKDDYANIRSLTSDLYDNLEKLDEEELIYWLRANNFPDYSSYSIKKNITN